MSQYGFTGLFRGGAGVLWLLLILGGCGDPQSSEEQIRRMVATGEAAVEAGSLAEVKPLISEAYRDEAGRTRSTLIQLIAGYLLRHRSVHLLIQFDRIDIEEPDEAEVGLYVAMAARPLPDVGQLLSVRADLLRFDLQLRREEGQWRVTSSRWRRASRDDFLK